MSNWYDKINDKEIQALKDNKMELELLDLEQRQLSNMLRQIPTDGQLQVFSGAQMGWTPAANGEILPLLTYRLDPDWTRPKEENKMSEEEERYALAEKGRERLKAMNNTPLVKCTSWSSRNSTGCYIIEKNGHELFLTEYEAQLIADQINNHIMEGEMAADAYKEAEERPF